jgi:hypothetical protein
MSSTVVQNNSVTYSGGFIVAYDLVISIDQYHFRSNRALFGGVFMISSSSLILLSNSGNPRILMMFDNNIANQSGGAIYAH